MSYWFQDPRLSILLPLANSTSIKGLATYFAVPRLIMGANVFPTAPVMGMSAPKLFAARCAQKRAFVVTDEFGQRFARRVVRSIAPAGFECEIWPHAQPEAPLDGVRECGAAMTGFAPDLIIAVGGGSVIDGAKAAWIIYERPDITDLAMITPAQPLGLRRKAALAAVPTTSGTGSECTAVSVVHDAAAHRKIPVVNPELLPDFAILCPQFTASMPAGLTAGTGLDALSHAVDAVCTPAANDLTTPLALKAIELVFKYLPRAYRNGKDREARHRMLLASCLAGVAFGQSSTALTHSFGHSLGSLFNIHHGLAVGFFIPHAIQFYSKVSDKYLAICQALAIPTQEPREALAELIARIKELLRELAVPPTLTGLGPSAEELEAKLPQLVTYSYEDISTYFSPRPITPQQCETILRYAIQGRDVDF